MKSSCVALPCSSPPRHSVNGCSALGGFCSCFASSGTAAKGHTATGHAAPAAPAAAAAALYPTTVCVHHLFSSNTHCPATSRRPTVCLVSPRMRQRLPTSRAHPVNLSPLILAAANEAIPRQHTVCPWVYIWPWHSTPLPLPLSLASCRHNTSK